MRTYVTLKKTKTGEVVDLQGVFVGNASSPKELTINYIDEMTGISHSTSYPYDYSEKQDVSARSKVHHAETLA